MNQGMYRAGPSPGGLPLPRARLGPLTGAIAALSFAAIVFPLVLLMRDGMSGAWMMFRNGGAGMYLLALLGIALPVALGLAGAVAVRGKRVPAGLFFGVPALPFFVSLFFGWHAHRMMESAPSGESIDPSEAMRINAEGMSEVLSLDIYGGFIACGCAIVGAIAAASVVASIDIDAATRDAPERPSSVLGAATLVSGAAWFVASVVLTAVRLKQVGALTLCTVLIVGALVPTLVLAARAAPALRTWHDATESRRASAALLVAGLAGVFAVVVFERAALAARASDVYGAIAGRGVDPSQKARILMELVVARKWTAIAYGVHGVLGTATFALALAGTIGNRRLPFSPSSVVALSLGVFVLAMTFALGAARARSTERIAARTTERAPSDPSLPAIEASVVEVPSFYSGPTVTLVLRADGTGTPSREDLQVNCGSARQVNVFANRAATVDALFRRLPEGRCYWTLSFQGTLQKDPALDAQLGDLAAYVYADGASLTAGYESGAFEAQEANGFVTVRLHDDDTIQYEGHQVKLPLGPDSPPLRASRYNSMHLVARPTTTIGQLVRVMSEWQKKFRANAPGVVIGIAYPPRTPPVDPPSGIRLQQPTVAGRLPPEVIQRIVRQSLGRVRQCYVDGLRKDPSLAGAVRVKFLIDRSGAVSTASDAGSTLPDRSVTACIVKMFGALTFPEPEGGIVVVTYPMTLGP